MGQYTDEYLKMMQGYENPVKIGNVIGTVIETFPNIKIEILNGDVILYPEMLYFCNYLLVGYTREIEATNIVNTNFSNSNATSTHKQLPSGTYNDYKYSSIDMPKSTVQKSTYTMKYTDTLKAGDKVMLCPSDKEDMWFVVSRVTRGDKV